MSPGPPATRFARWVTSPWAAAALLILYYLNAVTATTGKSNTFDELAHLTAGYSYWATGDYRLHPENGNLPQRVAGVALLTGGYRLPPLAHADWQQSNVWNVGRQFLFRENGRRADEMLQRGRAVMGLMGVAVGLVVWLWSRTLYGSRGGMVSLALFAFCPSMLAHGPLITSDTTAALFFVLSTGTVWIALHRLSVATVLGAALSLGGLALAKPSAPVIVPVILLLAAARFARHTPLHVGWTWRAHREWPNRLAWLAAFAGAALVAAGIVVFLIWLSFGFRYAAMQPSALGGDTFIRPWSWVMEDPDLPRRVLGWMAERRILPEGYLYGSAYALRMADQRSAFLLGEYSTTGWWWFFPYAFLVKTPLASFALLALAGAALWRRWRARGPAAEGEALGGLRSALPLWVLLAVWWTFAVGTRLNIGHRHLLPIYPVLFILAGAAGLWLDASTRRMRAAVVALLLVLVADSVAARPDYLAYFNQAIGNRDRAYRHLVDSSLDWGQDLPGLRRWLDEQGLNGSNGTDPVYLSYFGTGHVRYYGISATLLASFVAQEELPVLPALGGGVYAVSATMLQGVYLLPPGNWTGDHEALYQQLLREPSIGLLQSRSVDEQRRVLRTSASQDMLAAAEMFAHLRTSRLCAFLREREPDAEIGRSILIYRLTDREVREALDGPSPEQRAGALE